MTAGCKAAGWSNATRDDLYLSGMRDAELLVVAQVPHETNLPKMPVGGSGSDDGDATALEVDVVDPTRQVPNTCVLRAEAR